MTQMFPFVPSSSAQFQFSPTLDGGSYNASVPWLLYGARYYLSLASTDGTSVWFGAIVGSPPSFQLDSISWSNGYAYANTVLPHGFKPASTAALRIIGCSPDAYNVLSAICLITGPASFRYPVSSNPGSAEVVGFASRDVNMIGGVKKPDGAYFTSTLVFRTNTQTFEASP